VFEHATGKCIHACPDKAANEYVSRHSGRTSAGDLGCNIDIRRLKTLLSNGHMDISFSGDLEARRRRPAQAVREAHLRAAWLGFDNQRFVRSASDRRAAAQRDQRSR
jgi:hypothetical protein